MHAKLGWTAVFLAAGAMSLEGCQSTAVSIDFSAPGRWEVERQIEYYKIPSANLDGDIGPAYLVFPVTLAGFHDGQYGISVGPDDDVRYTVDGGESWTKAGNALACRHGLEIVDEKVAWHCGNGGIRVSVDGAKTWTTVGKFDCSYMSFLDARTGWAGSTYIVRTTSDGGASWIPLALPDGVDKIAAVSIRTAKDGYLLDTAGNLYVTGNGGESWEVRSLGLKTGERLIASVGSPLAMARFADARRGMVVFDLEDAERTVWFAVTTDGGRSWRRAEIPELRNRSSYFHLFLSRNLEWLTATDDFNNGKNISTVFRYRQSR